MPREGQPATPPGGSGWRGPRSSEGGAPTRAPTRRPPDGAPRQPRPPAARATRARTAPAVASAPADSRAAPPGSSEEHHWEAALDTIRPSRAWTAFKKASALTRWIILIVVVGIGTGVIVAVALAMLFTLVDSSV